MSQVVFGASLLMLLCSCFLMVMSLWLPLEYVACVSDERNPMGGGRTACSLTVADDATLSDSDDCDFLSLHFLGALNAALASAGVQSALM